MDMNKAIIAMVVAHCNFAGMNRKKFAEFAEKRKIYRQRLFNDPKGPIAFFVMGKGDEALSQAQFADLVHAEPLVVAMSSDTFNIRILSTLWLIEILRQEVYQKPGCEIHIVSKVGKHGATGEVRYRDTDFYGLKDLLCRMNSALPPNRKELLKYVHSRSSWVEKPGGTVRLTNALLKRCLGYALLKSRGFSLSEIDDRIPKVKMLCPPGNPEPETIPDLKQDIQNCINNLDQECTVLEHPSSPKATPQNTLTLAIEAISETYNWRPAEINLKLTPDGYVVVP